METKKFNQTGILSIAVMLPILAFCIIMIFINLKEPLSVIFFSFLAVTFLLCLLVFYKLTIEIDDQYFTFTLGAGLIKKKFALENIESCTPVKNSPFTGVGIRMLRHGWLYNVSGSYAVELRFRDRNTVVRVGSDQPEAVANEVNRRISNSAPVSPSEMKKDRTGWYLAVILFLLILVFPVAMIIAGSKPLEIKMSSEGFTIDGMFGTSVNYSGVTAIDTIRQLPPVKARTNGFASGSILKGKFKMKDNSRVRLYINKRVSPVIVIDYSGSKIYLNNKSREETVALYEQLKTNIGH